MLIFSGSEDYRWVVVHSWFPNPIIWTTFNLVFISIIQNFLLLGLSTPSYLIYLLGPKTSVGFAEGALLATIAALLSTETLADWQQNVYQKYKRGAKDIKKSYCTPTAVERGFIAGGLFTYSRHPNFFCEQLIWWCHYGVGCLATKTLVNWTIGAPTGLLGIFIGSTLLTESMSRKKYPIYRAYSKDVGMFFPKVLSLFTGTGGKWTAELDQQHVNKQK